MVGQPKAKASRCKRCKTRLSESARRCMKCGAQVHRVDPMEVAQRERDRLLRKYKLNEIQKRILSAAAKAQEIFVCGNGEAAEGEVKSGDERFYGNEAVMALAALAGLAGPGLISPHGEDCFRLTDDGTKLALTLRAELVGKA